MKKEKILSGDQNSYHIISYKSRVFRKVDKELVFEERDRFHWELCKHGLESSDRWYKHIISYQDLAFEVKRIHHVETAILPVVIGALGTVPKRTHQVN